MHWRTGISRHWASYLTGRHAHVVHRCIVREHVTHLRAVDGRIGWHWWRKGQVLRGYLSIASWHLLHVLLTALETIWRPLSSSIWHVKALPVALAHGSWIHLLLLKMRWWGRNRIHLPLLAHKTVWVTLMNSHWDHVMHWCHVWRQGRLVLLLWVLLQMSQVRWTAALISSHYMEQGSITLSSKSPRRLHRLTVWHFVAILERIEIFSNMQWSRLL